MNFALTKHWFTEIKEGRKTIEFRVKTDYWTTRLHKLNPGDERQALLIRLGGES